MNKKILLSILQALAWNRYTISGLIFVIGIIFGALMMNAGLAYIGGALLMAFGFLLPYIPSMYFYSYIVDIILYFILRNKSINVKKRVYWHYKWYILHILVLFVAVVTSGLLESWEHSEIINIFIKIIFFPGEIILKMLIQLDKFWY